MLLLTNTFLNNRNRLMQKSRVKIPLTIPARHDTTNTSSLFSLKNVLEQFVPNVGKGHVVIPQVFCYTSVAVSLQILIVI